jgi:hypothetical protein
VDGGWGNVAGVDSSAGGWGSTVGWGTGGAGGWSGSGARGDWGSSRGSSWSGSGGRWGSGSGAGGTRDWLGVDGDTNRLAELIGSLGSLLGISLGAGLQDAGSGSRDELLVGARALEVGQRAASGLEGREEAGLSASWDISNALGGGNGRNSNEGDSRELHFD